MPSAAQDEISSLRGTTKHRIVVLAATPSATPLHTQDIFSKVDKTGEGVCVQASTLGSLEALLAFLDSPDVSIPVSGINIGPVHKKDVLRANVMGEKGCKKYSVILAFDVPVAREAREMAEEYGVKIFTADIIYHLFDQFTAYMKTIKAQEQEAARLEAVFPCVLQVRGAGLCRLRNRAARWEWSRDTEAREVKGHRRHPVVAVDQLLMLCWDGCTVSRMVAL
jgi:translation initiation factor IF-2